MNISVPSPWSWVVLFDLGLLILTLLGDAVAIGFLGGHLQAWELVTTSSLAITILLVLLLNMRRVSRSGTSAESCPD